jgi:hypothetical protein
MAEPTKEEQMQIIPIRRCGHFFIAELMTMIPDPATETAECFCATCIINKQNEIIQKINELAGKRIINPLKPCGLFDLKLGDINPDTGKPVGAWVYNE